MAKLYFNKLEVSRYQELNEKLLNIVEQGIARLERQGTFRSLYDIEIVGVAVYYRKKWRCDTQSQRDNRDKLRQYV